MARPQKGKQLKTKELTMDDMTRTLIEGLSRAANNPNIWGYRPHNKQVEFHTSNAKGRLYIGGNRSGKTVGGVNEDIWWLQGNHPFKRTPPPPVYGRVVGVDFDNGIERILKPQFARWIPPSSLINGSWTDSYHAGTRTLNLANGSTVEFMSYVQDINKFAGTSRHFVHFDEEPPKSIFTENKARLVDTGGHWWITETPVEGMTWIYDDVYIPGMTDPTGNIRVIQVDIAENPYISQNEVAEFLSDLDPLERKARGEGKFVQLGGLIFKNFGPVHVVPSIDPRSVYGLRWFGSMDHGIKNPTAWLWHAVYPDGSVLTFQEHYENEWTVSQHASRIHLINQDLGRAPNYYVGDPAIKQRSGETGHSIQLAYQKEGIPIVLANNEIRAGIDKMSQYLLPRTDGRPTWRITGNCSNLIREMQRYRWKTWASAKLRDANNPQELPHPQNDHAVDAARYFFSFMPNLELRDDKHRGPDAEELKERIDSMLNIKNPVSIGPRYDPQWSAGGETTEWTAYDEGIGIF